MTAYKYLGVLTRQFRSRPDDYLVLVAMRHEPKSVKEKWYQPREEIKPLIEWANRWNEKGYNIYACWASFKGRERTIKNMSYSSAFVADWDGVEPIELDSTPTMRIETSPGRWQHVYTHELQNGSEVGTTYKALSKKLGGVDTISGDPVHLWRVPHYTNFPKPEKNRKPSPAKWDGQVNGRATFTFEDAVTSSSSSRRHTGRPLSRWMTHLLNDEPATGERSEQFHKLVCAMGKLGWSVDGIVDKLTGTWAQQKYGDHLEREVTRSIDKADIPEPKMADLQVIEYNPNDQEEVIRWLWYPYLPLNEVTLLDGDGGVGKTAMMLRIAKEMIEGGTMPNNERLSGGRKVLFISTESNYKRVTLPLLKRMGAKRRDHFYHVQDPEFSLSEEGIDKLGQVIKERGLHLVVIDPLAQFLPMDLEMNSYQHSVYLMSRLQAITEEMQCAIVLVRHNGKGTKEQLGHRGVGSVGWVSSCRSQLVVRRDPDDDDQYVVSPTKHQHASNKAAQAFQYEWAEIDKRGIVEWAGMSELSADELNEKKPDNEHRGKKKECEDWMREFLKERRPSSDVYTQGEARGFNRKMLERTAKDLKVNKSHPARRPDGTPGTMSYWELFVG